MEQWVATEDLAESRRSIGSHAIKQGSRFPTVPRGSSEFDDENGMSGCAQSVLDLGRIGQRMQIRRCRSISARHRRMERHLRGRVSSGTMSGRSTYPLCPRARLLADELERGVEGLTGPGIVGTSGLEMGEGHLGGGRGERNDRSEIVWGQREVSFSTPIPLLTILAHGLRL